MVLHLIIDKEYRQGLKLMKYALNHPWKFRRWYVAFLAGLIQFCMAMLQEYISILVILSTTTYIDAVKDFTALNVLNDFNSFFFEYSSQSPIYELLSNGELVLSSKVKIPLESLLKVETTTAFKPDGDENDPEPGPNIEPIFRIEGRDQSNEEGDSFPYPKSGCRNCFAMARPTKSVIIHIGDRSCPNKTGRLIYIFLKVFYMAFIFYWGLYLVP